jgi:tRNA modification GTPase
MAAEDTIFAVASGAGQAAVVVLRLSGPASGRILDALCGRRPRPREARLRGLRDRAGELLDRGLVLWFPGPGSYTGEDSAELHLHGGRAVVASVAMALVELGARPAEAGEFSRRAFLNGRMDLLEAEGIADLVAAETRTQQRQALLQMEGALGAIYAGWTEELRFLLADQEALIDFPEEDLPDDVEAPIASGLAALHQKISAHLDDAHRGERLREGLVFAVIGRPNVGKSSLINALVGRDVAIVSPLPGTTRDAIEARLVLGGVPVTMVDTAGLRESADEIEIEGVRRARERADQADLVIELLDASAGEDGQPTLPGVLRVFNKIDLVSAPAGAVGVCARTGEGLGRLQARLGEEAAALVAQSGPPALTRERHRAHLQEAAAHLHEAVVAGQAELRAEGMRLAIRSLGAITGAVLTEDILDTIFARFCIGK